MSLTQTLIGNQRPYQGQQQQVNPNLMALLSAIPRQRGGHYGMNGQEIDPNAPTGLGAFYQMQQDRAQQVGGVAASRMFARDALAKEQQARMNGGFIPQTPATNPQTQQAPANIWDQGYGTPGGQAPTPIAPQPVAPLHPAFNPHVGPAAEDAALGMERQTARLRGTEQFFGTPEATRAYYSGARPQVLAQMMGPRQADPNALRPWQRPVGGVGYRPQTTYERQDGMNQRRKQSELFRQMGF